MKISLINMDVAWKDKQENLKRKEKHIKKVLELFPETQTVVFPELSWTGYILDESNREFAEDENGFCITETKKLAKKYGVNIIAGYIQKNANEKPYNSAMVVSKDGELITTYSKNHLFSQSPEPGLYSPGKELVVCELEGWKCGIFICFDNRYPRLFESYKKMGVECIIGIHNWVAGRNKPEIFDVICKTRATENQYFVCGVDCSGEDENTTYTSSACISNPYSEDIKQTKEKIYHYAELNKNDLKNISEMLPLTSSFKDEYNF